MIKKAVKYGTAGIAVLAVLGLLERLIQAVRMIIKKAIQLWQT